MRLRSRRGSFGGNFGFRFGAPSELRLDQLVSFRLNAAESVFDFELALVQKVNDNLHILIEFVRHVIDSILNRF